MKDNYDELNDTFNTVPAEIEVRPVKPAPIKKKELPPVNISEDIEKDYRYTRGQLYSLIEKDKKQSMESWNLLEKVQVQEHMKLLVS